MSIVTIGIDLGKDSCSLAGLDGSGSVVLRRQMRPATVVSFASKLAPCTIAMEACCGAHYLGRLLAAQGHTVKLMAQEYVRPYVKAQKNDDRDAEGIAKASTRPTMRFVALKSQEQLDIQSLHRVRSRIVGARTTLINQLRALLLERGMTFAKGRRKFEAALDALLADDELPRDRIRQLLVDMREEWSELDQRINAIDEEFAVLARTDEMARRLTSIPGVGALNATAFIAAVGRAESFSHARDLGAFLGLVPRQHTTGGKPRLLGISKRGNTYLRTQLIHGAKAALPSLAKSETALGAWLRSLLARCYYNKLAKIAWALLRREETFSIGRAATV